MNSQPVISLVVCTHNRSKLLEATIAALASQDAAPERYEVLIVDNRSTDDTAEVARRCFESHPNHRFRLIKEEQLGLAAARNRGCQESAGAFVAYIDDDASVASTWVSAALATIERLSPVASKLSAPIVCGGPVEPVFLGEIPSWYDVNIETWIYGTEARFLGARENPIGANMMFRRSVLQEVGGFDPKFSLQGTKMLLGDEVDVIDRIRDKHGVETSVFYHPQMGVLHHIGDHRTKLKFILKRRFENGQSDCIRLKMRSRQSSMRSAIIAAKYLLWHSAKAILAFPTYRSISRFTSDRIGMLYYYFGYGCAAIGNRVTGEHRS